MDTLEVECPQHEKHNFENNSTKLYTDTYVFIATNTRKKQTTCY